MSVARVFFTAVSDGESLESIAAKASALAQKAFDGVVAPDRACAVKTHFGEANNIGYLKPPIVRAVVDYVKSSGGNPFVTDTNTLYVGQRSNAIDHLNLAQEHGFTQETLGTPVIIADGLMGTNQVTIPIRGGKHFSEVRIASAACEAAGSIVLSHVKGHCLLGFGGSLKNVGMGFSARAGKLTQHHGGHPDFDADACTACGTCVEWCPADAIVMEEKAALLPEKCIGCGECYTLCPHGAIRFGWNVDGPSLAEKVCEHALGFLSNKAGRVGYLNFLMDVTKDCDCMAVKQKPEYPNVGVFASTDVVAVDKAAADMSLERYGQDIWAKWWPDSNPEAQFSYGKAIGIGATEYELVEV